MRAQHTAVTSASAVSADTSSATGRSGEHDEPCHEPAWTDPTGPLRRRAPGCPDQPYPERDVGEEVERQSTAERRRRDCRERVVDVLDRLLQAECEEDDARDHRQMEVAVVVACELGALHALRCRESTVRADGVDVEVRPPERGDDDDAEDGGRDDAGRERHSRRADADRNDRLAEGDDHDQIVTFGEVRR